MVIQLCLQKVLFFDAVFLISIFRDNENSCNCGNSSAKNNTSDSLLAKNCKSSCHGSEHYDNKQCNPLAAFYLRYAAFTNSVFLFVPMLLFVFSHL